MKNYEKIYNAFKNNESKTIEDKWIIRPDFILYQSITGPENDRQLGRELVAIKIKGQIVCNSSRLDLVERQVSFGREIRRWSKRTNYQEFFESQGCLMLPFSVFKEAGLDLTKAEIIEQSQSETLKREVSAGYDKKGNQKFKVIDVHFIGAVLFKVDTSYFLFDVDRREVEKNIFNPFLVKLPNEVDSIKSAYQSLKPKEVLKAEMKNLKVKRQGEWFFIPTKLPNNCNEKSVKDLELRAGNNRPNRCKGIEHDKKFFVTGKVWHTGREHSDLLLHDWFIAIPNTATQSWQITGDID
jgi:hypothetical protein